MNEKNYKKRLDFQQRIISHQSKQIDDLKLEIEILKQKLKEKDELIKSVEPLRKEMTESVKRYKKLKDEFEDLIRELKKMKEIINQEVYKGRWKIVKFLIK